MSICKPFTNIPQSGGDAFESTLDGRFAGSHGMCFALPNRRQTFLKMTWMIYQSCWRQRQSTLVKWCYPLSFLIYTVVEWSRPIVVELKTSTLTRLIAEVDIADCRDVVWGVDDLWEELWQRSEEIMRRVDIESATVVHEVVATYM